MAAAGERAEASQIARGPLERLHGEIKRRTNLASILSNEAVITRPAGATLPEQGDE
jgi:hypothetical protein